MLNEMRARGFRKKAKGTGLHLCEIPHSSGLPRFLISWCSIKVKGFREVGDQRWGETKTSWMTQEDTGPNRLS